MRWHDILHRIHSSVEGGRYFTSNDSVPPEQRAACEAVHALLAAPEFDPSSARALAHRLFREGRVDRVRLYSLLHQIEAHPGVKD